MFRTVSYTHLLCFFRHDFLLGFGLLTERIHEKCRQSGIGFIHKEAGGILRADINVLRPFLEGLGDVYKRQGMLFGMIKSAFYELRSFDQSSVSGLSLIHI